MASDILFKLVVLALPTQLGLHFWPEFSRVLGLKIDYLSPTVYLSHLLIISLLLLNLKKVTQLVKEHISFTKILFTLFVVNSLTSLNLYLTALKWTEILIYYLFFLYIKSNRNLLARNLKYFYFTLLVVFLIQVAQFVNQNSLGGVLYWVGERNFTQTTSSIPKYQILGREFIRVPSTFSHANSLGGYMLLSLVALKFLKSPKLPKIISLFSILLSGSKNAIIFLSLYLSKKLPIKKVILACTLISFVLVIFSPLGSGFGYTINSRLIGISSSLKLISKHLLFGTGLGAYITGLGDQLQGSQIIYENLQPVHNIYFLLVSEIGLVGLLFLYCLSKQITISGRQSLILAAVLLTGMFDHYWLTLIQNKILLTILLASFPLEYET